MALLMEHGGKRPQVHPEAYVAPNAVLCGDVVVGEGTAVLYGAILTAEGGRVEVGRHCIVMENAVLRGTQRHPLQLGENVLVGPHSHLTGCTVESDVFLATGSVVFNGAMIGERAEVRIHGVVHVNTRLLPGTVVPIGWIAVGDPAQILPPEEHDKIWAVQKELEFPRTVFGLERPEKGESIMAKMAERYARALARHKDDRTVRSE